VLVMDARGVSGGASGRNGGIMWPSGEEPFELRTSARLREFCESRGVDGHWVGGGGVSLVDKVNLAGREEDDKGSDGDGGDGDGGEEAETEAFLLDGLEALDPVAVLGARPGAFQAVAYKDSRVLSFWPAKVVAGLAEAVTSAAEEAEPVQTDFNGSTPSSSSSSSSSSFAASSVAASSSTFSCRIAVASVEEILTFGDGHTKDGSSSSSTRSKRRAQLRTSAGGCVACSAVVVCTDGWLPRLVPELGPHFRAATNTVLCSTESVLEPSSTSPIHALGRGSVECLVQNDGSDSGGGDRSDSGGADGGWGSVCALSCGDGAGEVYLSKRRDGRLVLGGLRESGGWGGSEAEAHNRDGDGDGDNRLVGVAGGGGNIGGGDDAYENVSGVGGDDDDSAAGDAPTEAALKAWLADKFPALAKRTQFGPAWKGVLGYTKDNEPVVGPLPKWLAGRGGQPSSPLVASATSSSCSSSPAVLVTPPPPPPLLPLSQPSLLTASSSLSSTTLDTAAATTTATTTGRTAAANTAHDDDDNNDDGGNDDDDDDGKEEEEEEEGPVWVVGGFCGHGMPRCFGLAHVAARRLLGLPLDDLDQDAFNRFDVGRFFSGK